MTIMKFELILYSQDLFQVQFLTRDRRIANLRLFKPAFSKHFM